MDNFVELVEQHRNEFYRYIYRMSWDSSAADDIFSSAVLAAWENRHKFTPGTNFRAWMYRIILNKCFVANREKGRTPVSLDNVTESTFEKLTAEEGYEEWLDDTDAFLEECGDEVTHALRTLTPTQRTCFMLRSVNRFSYKEIAEIMDMPFGTVMTHLSRGRAKLRKELLQYAHDRGMVKEPRLRVLAKDQDQQRSAGQALGPSDRHMKNENRDNLWMAHIDGEMGVSESLAFEESLSPSEKKRLAAEKRLEQRLGDTLLEGPDCPNALWEQTKRAMLTGGKTKRKGHWPMFLAIAAAILIMLAGAWWGAQFASDPFNVDGYTVASLAAESDTAPEPEAVIAFAKKHGFDIALPNFPTTPEGSHHHVDLLGAEKIRLAGEDALAVHFACCGEPARVIMTHTGGKAARALRDADWAGKVQDFQLIGPFEAGVASLHPTDNLPSLLHARAAQSSVNLQS